MIALLAAHLVAAIVAPVLVDFLGRRALAYLAAVPAAGMIFAFIRTADVFSARPPEQRLTWIDGLNLDLWFRLDPLSWLMTLIVGGVGAFVLIYASRYFSNTSAGLRRFAAGFVAFAGAMLGVVTVDHSVGLYIFWEATSVFSFLLIGHHYQRMPARAAARQAILITTVGSLAMFVGFISLGMMPNGSFRLSELVEAFAQGRIEPSSPRVIVSAVLILWGAFSKSALIPNHFWLPGAMAAPTPVSAYLHAAAMVKAGVYLVARLTPGFAVISSWSPLIVVFGVATMIFGGWRALRQFDLKLVLAYGTVSQLGFITATVGQGSGGAMTAGLVMLIAHSFFKSTLFLTVGAVEAATGTRDLRKLGGLRSRKPVLACAAGLAALSMAGLPLTTGFLGKEALLSTLLEGSGAPWSNSASDCVVAFLVVCGGILTCAYSWRVWWGAFGGSAPEKSLQESATTQVSVGSGAQKEIDSSRQQKVGAAPARLSVQPTSFLMTAPIVVLSLGALIGFAPHSLERILSHHGNQFLPGHAHLAFFSGIPALIATLIILGGGLVLIIFRDRVEKMQERVAIPIKSVNFYVWTLRELSIIALRITRFVQRGSLQWDISTILVTLAVGVFSSLIITPPASLSIRLWDSFIQVGVAILIAVCAIATVRSRRRMRAAFTLGGVGLGVALLYASQGASDLALTQIVVEAVSIVVFVLVLRRLPMYFSDRPFASNRWWQIIIAVIAGVGTVLAGLYAAGARIHPAVSGLMPREAVKFGYGTNIVNVILVDIRAWDTVGELSVLLVTATGVASLIYVRSRSGRIDRAPSDRAPGRFLAAAVALKPHERSFVLEVVTRLLFLTMLVLSIWLLIIGHNNPGGGFAGGVLAGLAFALRYLAGGRHELGEAMPVPPGRIMGLGLFIAGAAALFPLLFGNAVLQSTEIGVHLGGIGDLHFTTAMILDIGVYVLVAGLVLDLISATGAEIDRQPSTSLDLQSYQRPLSKKGRETR